MESIIKVVDLKKDYTNDEVVTNVLYGVSFEIKSGEFTAIMGPSGSGKSTLMHILGFLDKLSSGQYLFKGQDSSELSEDQMADIRVNNIGFVFQTFNLLARTTVLDNVKLPLVYNRRIKERDRVAIAKKVIESVGLGHRLNHYSSQLSGGEKQRVAIARALVNDPDVIFADEPTGNLDSKSGQQVMEVLQDLNDKGKTIILVTHERYTAEHSQRIIRLKDGLIVEDEKVTNQVRARDGELQK
ncbi:MAG: ABC transporter ATP-binding protein [Patescibacteria group bacterium]